MDYMEEDWGLEISFEGYCSQNNDNSYQKCEERTKQFKVKTVKIDSIEKRMKELKIKIKSI